MNAHARHHEGPDIKVVAQMLADQALAFCQTYLPRGLKDGPRWRCGDVYGNPGQSLSVLIAGARQGQWKDFASDQSGDLIDLLAANQACGKGEAFKRAKEFLGISDATSRTSVSRAAEARATARMEARTGAVAEDQEQKRRWARELIRSCKVGAGTVVEAYLRGRGITLPVPSSLLLAPLLNHKPTGRSLPAMVAVVWLAQMEEGTDKVTYIQTAAHRTWLEVDELARWNFPLAHHVTELGPDATVRRLKALENGRDMGKMALGPMSGGFIPLTPKPVKSTLALTEGIENGLSVAQAKPEWSVWAAYSASNFANLIIPPAVRRLVLCGDGDSGVARNPDGSEKRDAEGKAYKPADVALAKAAQLHKDVAADAGRALSVEIWRPAPGKDANDMLREGIL